MKRSVSFLLVLSITTTLFSWTVASGQTSGDPFAAGHKDYDLPPGAVTGSSPQAQGALKNLSSQEVNSYQQQLDAIITDVRQNSRGRVAPSQETLAFTDDYGGRQFSSATRSVTATSQFTFAASPPAAVTTTCSQSIEQFVRAFYQTVLVRQPYASELTQWDNTLAQAQTQGASQLLSAAQSFGSTLFHSAEYASRNRSDPDYVYDLFKAYPNTVPSYDPYILAWVFQISGYGRDYVLLRFQVFQAFQDTVNGLCNAAVYVGLRL